ncbi:KTSC domain-containing protein [Bradyrhizobium cenepequi]|uniref:KTSC domain-containing protein n=1 Tax=Bradyrhizobium cenepequi TaxID=2821403 RepID=UPI001CE29D35|nr:KTSC domain-containing protein [Bradyrhizobium cenepequi]MCA6111557.1 KTSC domain-containing protein [Bradyrhizobium cenepequi]
MLRFVSVIGVIAASANWAAAEAIDVKYYGKLDRPPFACTDITRSSFIGRACYDKNLQLMIVQLDSVYHHYCEMPAATFEASASGKFYNATIKGAGSDGPFNCRTHRLAKY